MIKLFSDLILFLFLAREAVLYKIKPKTKEAREMEGVDSLQDRIRQHSGQFIAVIEGKTDYKETVFWLGVIAQDPYLYIVPGVLLCPVSKFANEYMGICAKGSGDYIPINRVSDKCLIGDREVRDWFLEKNKLYVCQQMAALLGRLIPLLQD